MEPKRHPAAFVLAELGVAPSADAPELYVAHNADTLLLAQALDVLFGGQRDFVDKLQVFRRYFARLRRRRADVRVHALARVARAVVGTGDRHCAELLHERGDLARLEDA